MVYRESLLFLSRSSPSLFIPTRFGEAELARAQQRLESKHRDPSAGRVPTHVARCFWKRQGGERAAMDHGSRTGLRVDASAPVTGKERGRGTLEPTPPPRFAKLGTRRNSQQRRFLKSAIRQFLGRQQPDNSSCVVRLRTGIWKTKMSGSQATTEPVM
ncbi:hypothetical protein MRX96_045131 [Rhipicephalus microplus]